MTTYRVWYYQLFLGNELRLVGIEIEADGVSRDEYFLTFNQGGKVVLAIKWALVSHFERIGL